MEISGKIIAVLPERSGTSSRGNEWKTQDYVVETQGDYPKKMAFQIFGEEEIAKAAIRVGNIVKVYFNIDAREHQGRWFNTITAWKVEHIR